MDDSHVAIRVVVPSSCIRLGPVGGGKYFHRLESDWNAAIVSATEDLKDQARRWVQAEITTLNDLLGRQPEEAAALEKLIQQIQIGLTAIW